MPSSPPSISPLPMTNHLPTNAAVTASSSSLVAFVVRQRRSELAIRRALGAQTRHLLTLMARETRNVVLVGLLLGSLLAAVTTRFGAIQIAEADLNRYRELQSRGTISPQRFDEAENVAHEAAGIHAVCCRVTSPACVSSDYEGCAVLDKKPRSAAATPRRPVLADSSCMTRYSCSIFLTNASIS